MAEKEPEITKTADLADVRVGTNPRPPRGGGDDSNDDLDFIDDPLDMDPMMGPSRWSAWGMRLLYGVFFCGVAGLVVYLVLIILYPERYGSDSWIGEKAAPEAPGPQRPFTGISLGGVYMGMDPDDVRRLFPNLQVERGPDGGWIGSFPHHDGQYRVWFRGLEYASRVYRVRSEHVYETISYLEVLSELSQRYGQPAKSTCGAEQAEIAIQCSLHWIIADIEVEALIRTAVAAGSDDARTLLSVVHGDTRAPKPITDPKPAPGRK